MKLEPAKGTALALRAVLEPEDVLREIGRRVALDLLPPSEEQALEAARARLARLEPELLSALACAMLAGELRASRGFLLGEPETAAEALPPYPARLGGRWFACVVAGMGARLLCPCQNGHDTADEAMACFRRHP